MIDPDGQLAEVLLDAIAPLPGHKCFVCRNGLCKLCAGTPCRCGCGGWTETMMVCLGEWRGSVGAR